MSGYIGSQPVPQATQTRQTFTATSGQTSFATIGYVAGGQFIQVYLNGVLLKLTDDYTAANGSDIVLTSGAATGDILEFITFADFTVNNQNFTGGLTVDNDGSTVLTVDRATSDGTIIDVQKSGSSVGSIGAYNSATYIQSGSAGSYTGIYLNTNKIEPVGDSSGNIRTDATVDLGSTANRFKDLYLSGGVYLGGTGAANKLDYYETGSWQPQIYYQNATNQSGATNVVQAGTYVKIGKFVHLEFRLDWTAPSGLANDNIGVKNLPFAAANNHYQHAGTMSANFASSSGLKFQTPSAGGTTIIVIAGNGSGNLGDDFGSGSGKFIRGTVSYVTQS